MKKIILALFAFVSVLNLTPAFADELGQAREVKKMFLINPEANEDVRNVAAGAMFHSIYIQNGNIVCDKNGIIDSNSSDGVKELVEGLRIFSKENIDPICFVRIRGQFADQTDKCILQRRNNKGPTTTCWYDYKKFLSQGSKIKTDEEFVYLAKAAGFFVKTDYCKKAPELTTKEKEECHIKSKSYITQLSKKNAPHCRDIIPEEYNKYLQGIKDLLTTVGNTQVVNAFGQKKQAETLMFQAIYGSAYEKEAINKLYELSFKNFCTIEGFEEDIKKLSGKNLFDKKNSNEIELN